MNTRTVLLALIALTAQAAPVLSPDGVNLSPSDPGINATVYAVQGSTWLVGWNDNPVFGDYDFNDFMYTVSFTDGHGIATFIGAISAAYNRAYVTGGMLEIRRNQPLEFLAAVDTAVQFTLITNYPWFRYDSEAHDSHMWAARTDAHDVVPTPEPSAFCTVVSAMFVLGLIRWALGRMA